MSIVDINASIHWHLVCLNTDQSEGDRHFRCLGLAVLYKELEIAELVQK
jgi:hypothetical protein